jgi:hypothetical protein
VSESNNELEWRRHLLTALDNVAKKVDENSAEHVMIRAEIAAVKLDVTALKATEPDKKMNEYINSSRGWRMAVVGQMVTILILIGTFIWNFSALNSSVNSLHENQIRNLKDVDDLKMTSNGYREWRTKVKAQEINEVKVNA